MATPLSSVSADTVTLLSPRFGAMTLKRAPTSKSTDSMANIVTPNGASTSSPYSTPTGAKTVTTLRTRRKTSTKSGSKGVGPVAFTSSDEVEVHKPAAKKMATSAGAPLPKRSHRRCLSESASRDQKSEEAKTAMVSSGGMTTHKRTKSKSKSRPATPPLRDSTGSTDSTDSEKDEVKATGAVDSATDSSSAESPHHKGHKRARTPNFVNNLVHFVKTKGGHLRALQKCLRNPRDDIIAWQAFQFYDVDRDSALTYSEFKLYGQDLVELLVANTVSIPHFKTNKTPNVFIKKMWKELTTKEDGKLPFKAWQKEILTLSTASNWKEFSRLAV